MKKRNKYNEIMNNIVGVAQISLFIFIKIKYFLNFSDFFMWVIYNGALEHDLSSLMINIVRVKKDLAFWFFLIL